MATALDIVKRSMRLAGVLRKGETPDSDESQDGLDVINTMLDSWLTEGLLTYQILEENFTLLTGFYGYTIGSGGDMNTTRPERVEDSCFILLDEQIYPVGLVNEKAYTQIQNVGLSGRPEYLYYERSYPLGKIWFDKTPNQDYEFHLKSWKQLQTFTALTTDLSLPAGYKRAIEFNGAVEFGTEFGVTIPAEVARIAVQSKANLKRINTTSVVLRSEVGLINVRGGLGNILTG